MPLPARSSDQEDAGAARVAHKRALDRKAQNAKRERTRLHIESLEQRVSTSEENARRLTEENERLKAENSRLQDRLVLTPPSTSGSTVHCDQSLDEVLSSNAQGEQSMSGFVAQIQSSSIFDVITHVSPEPAPPPRQLFQLLPCNSDPACLSDQILDAFIRSHSSREADSYENAAKSQQIDVFPLVMPDREGFVEPVLRVVMDVLQAFTSIAKLPEQVAGVNLMYKMLNWRVFPSRETYEEMPEWIRPIPLQLRIPHPAWMDIIPWPRVRAHLITTQGHYHFDEFSAVYSSSMTVSWSYNVADCVVSRATTSSGQEMVTSPIFEQHIRNLRNWNVTTIFVKKYPAIGDLIREELGFQ